MSALHEAATAGDTETIRTLLQSKCDLNKQDSQGFTALMRAVQNGHHTTAEILLNAKCDPDVTKEDPQKLIDSVKKKYWYWCKFDSKNKPKLVTHVRDLPKYEKLGTTALHIASSEGHTECVRGLINHGAALNIQNGNIDSHDIKGETALILAVRRSHSGVVKLLLEAGADMEIKTWGT